MQFFERKRGWSHLKVEVGVSAAPSLTTAIAKREAEDSLNKIREKDLWLQNCGIKR